MNDLISNIDSYVRINEIRLEIEYLKLRKQINTFLIVEGISDLSFFKKFILQEKCEIIFANGKDNVIETIIGLENEAKILGIVDADFWHLNKITPTSKNILVTDFHDIEIRILNTMALENILDEFCISEKMISLESKRGLKFREILFQEGSKIGFFRLLRNLNQDFSELNFKRLQFNSFLDTKEFQIDIISLIRTVFGNTKNWILIEENLKKLYGAKLVDVVVEEINILKEKKYDLLQICRGHDLTKILFIILEEEIGNKRNPNFPIDRKSLESSLRMAYTVEDFLKTGLFKDIKKWCFGNKNNILKEICNNDP